MKTALSLQPGSQAVGMGKDLYESTNPSGRYISRPMKFGNGFFQNHS